MSKGTLVGVVMISALMSSSLTLAAPKDEPYQTQGQQQGQQQQGQQQQGQQGQQKQQAQQGKQQGQQKQQAQQGKQQGQQKQQASNSQAKHSSPSRGWQRGDQVPKSYNGGKGYQVSDWKAHNLSRPPQGQHWLRVDGNYVLAAVASGIISTIIYR